LLAVRCFPETVSLRTGLTGNFPLPLHQLRILTRMKRQFVLEQRDYLGS
jgi:hypothetical protein